MNTFKLKGLYNIELTDNETLNWRFIDESPRYKITPPLDLFRLSSFKPNAQRDTPFANPLWTIKEIAITINLLDAFGKPGDIPNTLAKWANTRFIDAPDNWYHSVELSSHKANQEVRTFEFPKAYVKRYGKL